MISFVFFFKNNLEIELQGKRNHRHDLLIGFICCRGGGGSVRRQQRHLWTKKNNHFHERNRIQIRPPDCSMERFS